MRTQPIAPLPVRNGNRSLSTAVDRWVGVGPYYAMFPVDFAFDVIQRFSSPGDAVLDPFAGRATGIFAAATGRRRALGIEINPVGWLYGRVKLKPAMEQNVLRRLRQVASLAADSRFTRDVEALPDFFQLCYSAPVRRFLVCAREMLRWRSRRVDATLMAFILIYLHGKRSASFSNQMRDGKAMSPDYAVRWWRRRHMKPPAIEPLSFLAQRIEWRYKKGVPPCDGGEMRLGDCVHVLRGIREEIDAGSRRRFGLLFTSPPYCGVTNYHYDQWLRLWLLGGRSRPARVNGRWRRKFESRSDYATLIDEAFEASSQVMTRNAAVYVRTDAREFTLDTTVGALRTHFPKHRLRLVRQPFVSQTQTALFGDRTPKPGEVDIVLRR